MAEFTFYARGDSSTANNASINSINLSQQPVTELVFFPASGGDVLLEYNGGNPDADTLVRINGFETSFTVEFTATLPNTGRFSNLAGEDLRGAEVTVISIIDQNGDVQRFYFVSDRLVSPEAMEALPNGSIKVDNFNDMPPPVVICFASGTMIDTPEGPLPVEMLRAGDFVETDLGARPILWTGQRRVRRQDMEDAPNLRPVEIAAHAFGPANPSAPIRVSGNHRIVIEAPELELVLGVGRALCPVKHLIDGQRIFPVDGDITYHHLLLASHRLLTTSGLQSESFDPGPVGMATLSLPARAEVIRLLSNIDQAERDIDLPEIKAFEARALLDQWSRADRAAAS